MKKIIIFYQKWISPFKKQSCKFYPTCSEYALQAFTKYSPGKATYLSIKRILRCHPWQQNQIDHP
ncbi:MAG TPA: membrane protein insertion efficiency factor YidD [Candidatus Paceibacterota bacterium]|nr:membrane protein insertion efficiency factor YidD [Candidatus Paceibacterota bacterium]